jgi:hypothetical protein
MFGIRDGGSQMAGQDIIPTNPAAVGLPTRIFAMMPNSEGKDQSETLHRSITVGPHLGRREIRIDQDGTRTRPDRRRHRSGVDHNFNDRGWNVCAFPHETI